MKTTAWTDTLPKFPAPEPGIAALSVQNSTAEFAMINTVAVHDVQVS